MSYLDLAENCGYTVKGLYHYNDSRTGEMDHGYRILGSSKDLLKSNTLEGLNFMLSMGNTQIRSQLFKKISELGGIIPTMIHPSCVISKFVKIGIGVCISAFTHVQADTKIGDNTVILSGVNISHTNVIGNNCFIAGGATIGAYTILEDYVFVGQGVLTISSKVPLIGQHALIGAGTLVCKAIEPFSCVAGRPARVIQIKNKESKENGN